MAQKKGVAEENVKPGVSAEAVSSDEMMEYIENVRELLH